MISQSIELVAALRLHGTCDHRREAKVSFNKMGFARYGMLRASWRAGRIRSYVAELRKGPAFPLPRITSEARRMTPNPSDSLSFRSYGAEGPVHSHDHAQIVLPVWGTLEIEVGGRGGCLDQIGRAHV